MRNAPPQRVVLCLNADVDDPTKRPKIAGMRRYAAAVGWTIVPSRWTKAIGVALNVPGADLSSAHCHLTDTVRTYTEVPLEFDADGTAVIRLQPNSFALVDWCGISQ